MNIFEEKREINNGLFREYSYNRKDKKYLYALINYNYDLISYTIFKFFENLKYNKEVYEVALASMMYAIENYEMDKMSGFEEYLVASIKLDIEKFTSKVKPMFVCTNNQNSLNMGDIWYNKNHNLEETLNTKKMRDGLVDKEYRKTINNNFKNKMKN